MLHVLNDNNDDKDTHRSQF